MTKKEFIDAVASQSETDLSKKDTQAVLEAAFAVITQTTRTEGKLSWPGFGTFSLLKRPARKGRHPQTGAAIKIKASQTMTFKVSPTLKASLQ